MNYNSIQNIQNIQNIQHKKRKYDNFTSGNFEKISHKQTLNTNKRENIRENIRENKRLRLEVINLNNRIKLLETQFQNLYLEVNEIKKKIVIQQVQTDEIPPELKMFYYT